MELTLILLAAILGFTIVIISVPPILRVARAKKLFDTNDDRKIHTSDIPPLGGVAIFLGFVLSTIIATDGYSFDSLKYIIAGIIKTNNSLSNNFILKSTLKFFFIFLILRRIKKGRNNIEISIHNIFFDF